MYIFLFRLLNYAFNMTELLCISSQTVRISFFEDLSPLVLHFPAHQRLNDGRWNNLVFTWNSNNGEYSLIWNAVRIFTDKGYAANRQLNIK